MAELADGARWRWNQLYEVAAWHAANVMNATGMMKRRVTPDALLGRQRSRFNVDLEDPVTAEILEESRARARAVRRAAVS